MAFRLKAIKPKTNARNAARTIQAVKSVMEAARDGALKDYLSCTRSWDHTVVFEAIQTKDGWIVGTEDEVFQYVDEGTEPHTIAPKPGNALRFYAGGAPKSTPHIIGSNPGRRGDQLVFTRKPVHHPGTEAREFTEEIHKKWEAKLPDMMQEEITKAIG